jgi:hypothetical protein
MAKAVTIIMPDDLFEASKVVIQDLGMSMSGFMRRRLIYMIADWSAEQETNRFDDLLKKYGATV